MELPFPGRAPFLEAPSLWSDVHHSLTTVICHQIQNQLNSQYGAVIEPYMAFERLEIRSIHNDTANVREVASDVLPVTATMEVPTCYARLEIRMVGDEVLVVAIALLPLRNGQRPRFATILPDHPYFVFLGRTEHRPQFDV